MGGELRRGRFFYEAAYVRLNCLERREYVSIMSFDECSSSDANGRNEY